MNGCSQNRRNDDNELAPSLRTECRNRSIVIGQVDDVLLTVVYTSPEEGLYRIVSARLVTAQERKAYEQNFFHP